MTPAQRIAELCGEISANQSKISSLMERNEVMLAEIYEQVDVLPPAEAEVPSGEYPGWEPPGELEWHEVMASSFADPADIRAFRACKAKGHSDQYCFRYGDNGVGKWGDDTTTSVPMCALPPDDWKKVANPRGKEVIVRMGEGQVVCELRDTMPWKKNIKNGCGIDLNFAACQALGVKVPLKRKAKWAWAPEEPKGKTLVEVFKEEGEVVEVVSRRIVENA